MDESSINCRMHDAAQNESARVGVNWVPLSDLAEVNPRSPSPTHAEPVSFVAMEDVSRAGVIDNIQLRKASTGYTPFVAGDVLVAKITSCFENGKGAHVRDLSTRCGLGSTEFHVLRAHPATFDRYLYHLTRTAHFRLGGEGMMSGSAGQRRVPTEFFDRYAVRMPSIEEQRRIAEVLDTIDETIQAAERVLAKSRRVEVAFLMESIDFSRSEARLGDVCSLLQDGTHLPPPRTSEGPLLLSVQNLDDGRLRPSARDTRIPEAFWRGTRRTLPIEPGDVCLAVVGATLGKVGVVPPGLPPFTVQRSLTVLRGDPMRMHNDYLFAVMRHEEFQRNLWQRANQTAQPGVYLGELRTIGIPSPPLAEQQRIVSILDTINETTQANEKQLSKLRGLRSGLAADLLSGRVRTVAA